MSEGINELTYRISLDKTFRGQSSPVQAVVYEPCQKQIISGSADGLIMAWNFGSPNRVQKLHGHNGCIHSLDVSQNGQFFASGSADKTVRLWKRSIRTKSMVFVAHSGRVLSVRISADGHQLLTSSSDKMVKLWDLKEGNFMARKRPLFLWCAHGHRNWVRSADISFDKLKVCSGGDDKVVKVWDGLNASEVCTFDNHTANIRSVQFDPLEANCVASAGDDAVINLWDIRTKYVAQHYSLPQHKSPITTIRFHPSGKYLISGSADAIMRVFDLREGRPMVSISAHTQSVNSIAFLPEGDGFISGGADKIVLAWCCKTLCSSPTICKTDTVAKAQSENNSRMQNNPGVIKERNKIGSDSKKAKIKDSDMTPVSLSTRVDTMKAGSTPGKFAHVSNRNHRIRVDLKPDRVISKYTVKTHFQEQKTEAAEKKEIRSSRQKSCVKETETPQSMFGSKIFTDGSKMSSVGFGIAPLRPESVNSSSSMHLRFAPVLPSS